MAAPKKGKTKVTWCLTHRQQASDCTPKQRPCTTSNEQWAKKLIIQAETGLITDREFRDLLEDHLSGRPPGSGAKSRPESPHEKEF